MSAVTSKATAASSFFRANFVPCPSPFPGGSLINVLAKNGLYKGDAFEDWIHQVARNEDSDLALITMFVPLFRVDAPAAVDAVE